MTPKILSLILFIAFSISIVNCSDDDNRRRQRRSPEEQARELQEALGLSEEQTIKAEEIYKQAAEEMVRMREDFNGDRDKMREKMREVRLKIDEQINEILDDNQREKYTQFQNERRERMREWRRDRD